ncbi:MAG: uroporphyrinogen decarboxylase family protein [Coprococcus sp.]
MNHEILLEKEEFQCPGLEVGTIGTGVLKYGKKVFQKPQYMYQAALINQKENESCFLKLPLNYNEELKALGGETYWNGQTYLSKGYQYQSIKDMYHIAEICYSQDMFKTVFQCLEKTDRNDKVMLCVEGPFSVLCSLINVMNVLRDRKKEKLAIQLILTNITDILAEYIIQALKYNVKIVSLAEPVASLGMLGEKCYREFSGKYIIRLLQKIRPYLKDSCIHLCGKCSSDLKSTKMITYEKIKCNGEYAKCVIDAARENPGCIVGNGCINCERMHVNEIYLVKFDNTVLKLSEKVV